MLIAVEDPSVKRVMDDLRSFCKCDEGWGRQRAIAKTLKISEPLVSAWVNGKRLPDVHLFFRLKKLLDKEMHSGRKTLAQLAEENNLTL